MKASFVQTARNFSLLGGELLKLSIAALALLSVFRTLLIQQVCSAPV